MSRLALPYINGYEHYPQSMSSLKQDFGNPTLIQHAGCYVDKPAVSSQSHGIEFAATLRLTWGTLVRTLTVVTPGSILPDLQIMAASNDVSGNTWSVAYYPDGRLRYRMEAFAPGPNFERITTLARTVRPDTWHYIEAYSQITPSADPNVDPILLDGAVYIDGVEVLFFSNQPYYKLMGPLNMGFNTAGPPGGIAGQGLLRDHYYIAQGDIYGPYNRVALCLQNNDELLQWTTPPTPPHYVQIDERVCDLSDAIATRLDPSTDRFTDEGLPDNVNDVPFNPAVVQSVFYGVGFDKIEHVYNDEKTQGVYSVFSCYPIRTFSSVAYVEGLKHGVRYSTDP